MALIKFVITDDSEDNSFVDALEFSLEDAYKDTEIEYLQFSSSDPNLITTIRTNIHNPIFAGFWIEKPEQGSFLEQTLQEFSSSDKVHTFTSDTDLIDKLGEVYNTNVSSTPIEDKFGVLGDTNNSVDNLAEESVLEEQTYTEEDDVSKLFEGVPNTQDYENDEDEEELGQVNIKSKVEHESRLLETIQAENNPKMSVTSDYSYEELIKLLNEKDETIKSYQSQLKETLEFQISPSTSIENYNQQEDIVPELEETIDELTQKYQTEKEITCNLEKQVIELNRQIEIHKETSVSKEEYKNLQLEVSSLRKEKDTLYTEYKELTNKHSSVQIKVESLERTVDEKELLLKDKSRKLDTAEIDRRRMSSELEELKSRPDMSIEVERLKQTILEKDNLINEIKQYSQKHENKNQSLESQIQRLKKDSLEDKRALATLNKELLKISKESNNLDVTSNSSIDLPLSVNEIVWDGVFKSTSKASFKNVEFIFSGSGDSIRETYLIGKKKLKDGGVFIDLSLESQADYRFGLNKTKASEKWITEENAEFKDFLIKTNTPNVFCIVLSPQSYNDLYLRDKHYLLERLQELDTLNQKIVVYGGHISHSVSRSIMFSGLESTQVTVVSKSLGTSARAMLYNSMMVGQSIKAKYLLVGQLDKMSKQVARIASKKGFEWELVNES